MEPVEFGLGVALTATSGSANKEVERQGALALLQLAGQVGPQIIQLVQLAEQNPGTATADVALQSARGLDILYKRTLAQYDVRDVEDVAFLADLVDSQAQTGGGVPTSPRDFGGGPGSAAGAQIDPGLAALLAGAGPAGGAAGG
jgi:hypothetical protein